MCEGVRPIRSFAIRRAWSAGAVQALRLAGILGPRMIVGADHEGAR